jgi:hypothetical protein
MGSLKLPKTIIKQIDKYRKHCLWRGGDINAGKPAMAAWSMVTKPKTEGGLRVLKIQVQNDALLMKNLDMFFNNVDIPQVTLIWDKYYQNGETAR